MSNDKIPLGKFKLMKNSSGEEFNYLSINIKDGIKIKSGDIITLDMIEPYESEAVRKVADYINKNLSPEFVGDETWSINYAKEIIKLVHEAEDSDE
ncbi:MAG: hypothetical protein ACHQ1D_06585 [Nitrososphaerales archaeon]|jgi:hypothetical protein